MDISFRTSLFIFVLLVFLHRGWETFSKSEKKPGEVIKKWTLYALTSAYVLVGVVTILEYFMVGRKINFVISCVGFCMYLVALVGRNCAIKALGEYHSIHIQVGNDHVLIKEGPYKYLRHPYYLSVMLEVLGIPLILNSYYGFLSWISVYLPLLFTRLCFEEKLMIEKFGEKYKQYKKETWGLLPMRKRGS